MREPLAPAAVRLAPRVSTPIHLHVRECALRRTYASQVRPSVEKKRRKKHKITTLIMVSSNRRAFGLSSWTKKKSAPLGASINNRGAAVARFRSFCAHLCSFRSVYVYAPVPIRTPLASSVFTRPRTAEVYTKFVRGAIYSGPLRYDTRVRNAPDTTGHY